MDKTKGQVETRQLAAGEGSSSPTQKDAEEIIAVLAFPIGANATAIVGTVGYFCGDDEPLGAYRWDLSTPISLEEAARFMDFISGLAEQRVLGR